MVVYAQNGERLRPEQGYPVRLLLPGFEGNMNVKWLRRLKVGDQPWYTREETSRYTSLLANGKAYKLAFAMDVKSVVTFPNADRGFKAPGFYEISGIAWSGRGHITRVDVSVDGGEEMLFAGSPRGAQEANWIEAGSHYEFRLYNAAHEELQAKVIVTRDS